jgi:putative salt-induced outer membrane protein
LWKKDINMTHTLKIATLVALTGSAVAAQNTTFSNQDAATTAVDAIQEQIAEDNNRDLGTFGNQGRALGSFGSVSLRATATNDDNENAADVGIGLRFGSYDGLNGYDVALSYSYGQNDGVETDNNLLAGLDYRRDFGPSLFAYGQADLAFDRTADQVGDYSQDIFIGAGVGYRIFNDADTQWSVQAGPGYRIASVVGGQNVEEAAASVSSNFYKSLSQTSYITNDTDVIYSEAATVVNNELALNVSMTDTLSLRTGLTTQFNDANDSGFGDARNTLGVSVVYNFN